MRTVFLTALFFVIILVIVPLLIGSFKITSPVDLDVNVSLNVYLASQNKYVKMELGHYLVGVIAAEMPANFEYEALRAQAVAARTYVYRRLKIYGGSGCQRYEADVCTSSLCCQAYNTIAEMKSKWGNNYKTYYNKICKAVSSTKGWIIVHNNTPIDPLFHSTCGGHTENSGEVWQKDIEYLTGVKCEYCGDSPKYYSTKKITINQASLALAENNNMVLPVANLKSTLPRMSINKYTATNRVAELKIGNITYEAVNLRKSLDLNSTWFNFKVVGDCLEFNTRGYGHGVGMCQYGANGMAKKGFNCQEILKKYYQGIEIKKIKAK